MFKTLNMKGMSYFGDADAGSKVYLLVVLRTGQMAPPQACWPPPTVACLYVSSCAVWNCGILRRGNLDSLRCSKKDHPAIACGSLPGHLCHRRGSSDG